MHAQPAPSAGYYEPSATVTWLPRCACGHRHPLTCKPHAPNHPDPGCADHAFPTDPDTCPACGAATAKGKAVEVPAVLSGWAPSTILARVLLAVGKFLAILARKV